MRKHRSVISILLAVMMIFTFMPAMSFATNVDPTTLNPWSPVPELTNVSWASDYHTARATVQNGDSTQTITFEEYKYDWENQEMPEATPAEAKSNAQKYFVLAKSYKRTDSDHFYVKTYTLGVAKAEKRDGDDHPYWYPITDTYGYSDTVDWTVSSGRGADVKTEVKVFDITAMPVSLSDGTVLRNDKQFDGGLYSAWYATKDFSDKQYADLEAKTGVKKTDLVNPIEVALVGRLGVNVGQFEEDEDVAQFDVTYPAYDAYEFETAGTYKTLPLTIKPIASEIKTTLKAISSSYSDVEVADVTRTFNVQPRADLFNRVASTAGKYWGTWNVDGSKWNDEADYYYFTYDGKVHNISLVNEPKNVKLQYYMTQGDKNGNWVEPKESDWTDTFAGIKDAGTYMVAVRFVSEFDGTVFTPKSGKVVAHKTVIVNKFTPTLMFKQDKLVTEYGKYTAESLEQAIKELMIIGKTPDSADKIAEAVYKYATVKGLFTDAGENTLYAAFDNKAFAADKDLYEALKNYEFEDYYGEKETAEGEYWGLRLVIQKVSNDVEIKAPSTKTFKANKKTKKLAKNKSFTISATSRFGNVSFSKLSGNNKIKVSKTGKITVKKGLKKGKTYKIKVKALAQGTANYAQAYAKKTIAIKIK